MNLISELETYSYPDRKREKNEPEVPIKENDHDYDALRYALVMDTASSGNFVIPAPTIGLVPNFPGGGG